MSSKKWIRVRIEEVAKQIRDSQAVTESNRYFEYQKGGKNPSIWHSELNGYRAMEGQDAPDSVLPGWKG